MKKWHLISNCTACSNCNNCVLALNDEYVGNAFPGYSAPKPAVGSPWLKKTRKERGNGPMIDVSHYLETCMNCRNPACVNEKTKDVVYQRDDGIVIIDPEKAKGRRDIVGMCPHGHIHWNEELQLPQKWTWDAHLLDQGWKEPRAAQVCPTGGLVALKAEDAEMDARVAAGELQMRDSRTGSRLYDKNFERVTHAFLGGTVKIFRNGVEDCVEGATVVLRKNGEVVAELKTDAFGDFKFDGLAGQGEELTVTVEPPDGEPVRRKITLESSHYLGAIEIPA
ncbi:MAG: 4Fe-4S dicluster domain-containing protein [Pseudomonadota bacterium]